MHFESILGTINSYTKQRIEKALENYVLYSYRTLVSKCGA